MLSNRVQRGMRLGFLGLMLSLCVGCGSSLGTTTDSGNSDKLVSGVCADGDAVSVGSSSSSDSDTCASISVFLNLQEDSTLSSTTHLIGEAIATGLADDLKRASVLTNDDVQVAVNYQQMVQLLGGDDTNDIASQITSAFTNSDIVVLPLIPAPIGETYVARIVAYNRATNAKIAEVGFTGSGNELAQGAVNLGKSLADKIKMARVCLNLSPEKSVIDFDDTAARTQAFTATVKDLKDESVNSGSVDFSLERTEWGTLSSTNATISNGEATTTFTMTKRQPNSLTVTYTGDYAEQTDQATIIPLCGWILTIEGQKVFALNHATPALFQALFGEGSWITMNGTSTMNGHVVLTIEDDEVTAYGTGWLTEEHQSTAEIYTPIRSPETGEVIGECSGNGTTQATATGDWMVWGTSNGSSVTLSGLGLGSSPVGQNAFASCNLAGMGASGGGDSSFTTLSDFSDVAISLKQGATGTAQGKGSLFEETYQYTLTLRRAAP